MRINRLELYYVVFSLIYSWRTANGADPDVHTILVKLIPDGTRPPVEQLAYSTFLGGSGYDASYAIAVDSSGTIYAVDDLNNKACRTR